MLTGLSFGLSPRAALSVWHLRSSLSWASRLPQVSASTACDAATLAGRRRRWQYEHTVVQLGRVAHKSLRGSPPPNRKHGRGTLFVVLPMTATLETRRVRSTSVTWSSTHPLAAGPGLHRAPVLHRCYIAVEVQLLVQPLSRSAYVQDGLQGYGARSKEWFRWFRGSREGSKGRVRQGVRGNISAFYAVFKGSECGIFYHGIRSDNLLE